jgi:hypothetical protein
VAKTHRNNIGSAECNLLSLREKLINITAKLHLANIANWEDILGLDLGSIENIKVKLILTGLGTDLDTEFPRWISALLNRILEILAMEVRVISCELQSFIPDQRVHSKSWSPMELHKRTDAFGIHKSEGVDTEALYYAEQARDSPVTHRPYEYVCSFRMQVLEIPEVVMGALGLRDLIVRLSLASMDNVWELYGVLNEENWDIISNQIPVSLLGIEFGCEPAHIANSIGTAVASKDGGEADKD